MSAESPPLCPHTQPAEAYHERAALLHKWADDEVATHLRERLVELADQYLMIADLLTEP